jgi:hypothetical protein
VPEGRTAFVEGWHEFANPVLKDAAGNIIPTSVTLVDDTTLVQTTDDLPAGDYTLTYDCGDNATPIERDLSVAEAAPLPATFGGLVSMPQSELVECSELEFIPLKWTPPFEFFPYLDLVQLTFSVDGVDRGALPLVEPLASDLNGNVLVNIPNCDHFEGTCGFAVGTYALRATIAGHSEQWLSPEAKVNPLCFRNTEHGEPEDIGCALVSSPRSSRCSWVWLTASLATLLRVRRRTGASKRWPD